MVFRSSNDLSFFNWNNWNWNRNGLAVNTHFLLYKAFVSITVKSEVDGQKVEAHAVNRQALGAPLPRYSLSLLNFCFRNLGV